MNRVTHYGQLFCANPVLKSNEALVGGFGNCHAVNLAYVKDYPLRAQNDNEHKSHGGGMFLCKLAQEGNQPRFIVSGLK